MNASLPLSLSENTVRELVQRFGTPLWVYDAATVRERIEALRAFDTIRFAQKACSNTHILRLMRAQGVKVDAVSHGEILRALAAGYEPGTPAQEIVFTADVLDAATLACVAQHRIPVNAGSIDMLHQLAAVSPGHPVWLRLNPGFGHGHSNKTNTGGEHSKHGIWHTEFEAALEVVRARGLVLAGLHMHIGSGVDYAHLAQVGEAMLGLVRRAHALGLQVPAISAGGGLSIPYQAGAPRVDVQHYFGLWDEVRRQAQQLQGREVHLEIEPGRYLVAESGVLLSEVRAVKDAGANHFVLVDAGFNELMRPAMYGAYHAMSLVAADAQARAARLSVVAGPLCESGDVFTQGEGGTVLARPLPQAQVGDWLVVHDTGAYGASMSSNYNSRPLAAEVLLDGAAPPRLIRRRQTVQELLDLEAV
ncbi:diaminopimelate decarboxylase [Roseateles sp. BYS180W]|uniref:Diaminopimelate decarboxylase n=1 Tax=Roseateles rivi TaxID=3299028 RepID=A0ABW7FXM2_9BURK